MKLDQRVAIITGAGSGIGRASAILFAKEGAKIVVADINEEGGKKTVDDIKADGGEAIFIRTDVSKASDVKNLIESCKDQFGKIDILFNVAGTPQNNTPIEEYDEELFDKILSVNVKSVFLTTKYVIPVMKAAGKGVILNLASMGGVRARPGTNVYASSKAAVIHFSKAVAVEVAANKIRVNYINPAAVDTPMLPQFRPSGMDLEEFYQSAKESMPLGRIAKPEDVAYAALFLASDESSLVTGTGIDVNGGGRI
jgi:3-oxoacyl-[acyl-carrier protein] reductase